MDRLLKAAALLVVGGMSANAGAAIMPDTVIVPLFAETCLKGDLSLSGRTAAIEAAGWQPLDAGDLDVRRFEAANPINIDFKKPDSVRQWHRTVDGKDVRAVVAGFSAKGGYPALCAALVPEVGNAMPYLDGMRDALKPLGVKAKSTDLPHYQEYSGKLADGRHSRANIFSRSQVVQGAKKTMHLMIAY